MPKLTTSPVTACRRALGLLVVASLSLAGCATPWAGLPPVPPTETATYHLGAGDRVRVITVGDQQLTGEFRISDNGTIAIPLLGTVQAAGLTPAQLGDRVAAALQRTNLFKHPSVSVEVVAYRPIFVLGEVNKPGEYPYQPGETVLTAVAVGGGFTYRAVTGVFSIVRTTTNDRAIEGRAGRQSFLEPGDVLTVYERRF